MVRHCRVSTAGRVSVPALRGHASRLPAVLPPRTAAAVPAEIRATGRLERCRRGTAPRTAGVRRRAAGPTGGQHGQTLPSAPPGARRPSTSGAPTRVPLPSRPARSSSACSASSVCQAQLDPEGVGQPVEHAVGPPIACERRRACGNGRGRALPVDERSGLLGDRRPGARLGPVGDRALPRLEVDEEPRRERRSALPPGRAGRRARDRRGPGRRAPGAGARRGSRGGAAGLGGQAVDAPRRASSARAALSATGRPPGSRPGRAPASIAPRSPARRGPRRAGHLSLRRAGPTAPKRSGHRASRSPTRITDPGAGASAASAVLDRPSTQSRREPRARSRARPAGACRQLLEAAGERAAAMRQDLCAPGARPCAAAGRRWRLLFGLEAHQEHGRRVLEVGVGRPRAARRPRCARNSASSCGCGRARKSTSLVPSTARANLP